MMSRQSWGLAVIAALCVLPAACENFEELGEAARCRSFPSQCALSDAGADAGTTDAGVDGGGAGDSGVDAGSDGGVDAGPRPPCDETEKPVTGGLFVSPMGLDSNNGTAGQPFKSIAAAIEAARNMSGATIYLEQAVYSGQVVLDGGVEIRLRGGWQRSTTGTWARNCADDFRSQTVLKGQSPVITIRDVSSIVGPVYVEDMSITTESPEAGGSSIGILVSGSAVSLVNVAVFATAGGHAGPATPMATAGSVACNGGGASDGANGPDFSGAPAAHSDGGTFGLADFMPGNGEAGTGMGSNGNNGTPGDGGTSAMCFDGFCGCGAFGDCTTPPMQLRSSNSGKNGCGGLGGAGGPGGRGGGASAAVVALNGANVTASFSALEANAGGNGSAGQSNPGGMGTTGTSGGPYSCAIASCAVAGSSGGCSSTGSSVCFPGGDPNWRDNASLFQTLPGGAAGGKGGNGGAGQRGGDGAGGPSHAVVLVGNSSFDGGVETTLSWKQGGDGGLARSGRSEGVAQY